MPLTEFNLSQTCPDCQETYDIPEPLRNANTPFVTRFSTATTALEEFSYKNAIGSPDIG